MGNRYKEFLIDILVKAYQIILAVVIVTPVATKQFDSAQMFIGSVIIALIIIWSGAISKNMEGDL